MHTSCCISSSKRTRDCHQTVSRLSPDCHRTVTGPQHTTMRQPVSLIDDHQPALPRSRPLLPHARNFVSSFPKTTEMTLQNRQIRPSWIIVCDQFGLMHAPFAQARTFLSEHGFGETKVALHAEDGAVVVVKAKGRRYESRLDSNSLVREL